MGIAAGTRCNIIRYRGCFDGSSIMDRTKTGGVENASGYYRFPTILDDVIAFVSEDDLWCVSSAGGEARRLTSGLGSTSHPAYSRDRKWLAFSGREEGPLE